MDGKKSYTCMYTDQLLRKNPTWADGFVVVQEGNGKVLLLNEDLEEMDAIFLLRTQGERVKEGGKVDFERHRVLVGEECELVNKEEEEIKEIQEKEEAMRRRPGLVSLRGSICVDWNKWKEKNSIL
ncbi:hypothetical protein BT69DRAFT_1288065 [Atractiella rhizophila]|nr:hypothetical protein BT69DRAFT_1288065 [Atractiella rhizophila]